MSVFSEIYESNSWTNGSGPGSHPEACRPLIDLLNRFLNDNNISSIVDFGCGDWQFMSNIDLKDRTYTGFDLVDSVLTSNRLRYARQGVSFQRTPEQLSDLPGADLLFVKDVMIHLPNTDILDLITYFRHFKYVIAVNNRSNHDYAFNSEIEVGGFRPVDLNSSPFNQHCATILTYGSLKLPQPGMPKPIARLLRRYIWPGEKHVQLLFGRNSESEIEK